MGLDRIGADKGGVRIGIYWTQLRAGLLGQVAYYPRPHPSHKLLRHFTVNLPADLAAQG